MIRDGLFRQVGVKLAARQRPVGRVDRHLQMSVVTGYYLSCRVFGPSPCNDCIGTPIPQSRTIPAFFKNERLKASAVYRFVARTTRAIKFFVKMRHQDLSNSFIILEIPMSSGLPVRERTQRLLPFDFLHAYRLATFFRCLWATWGRAFTIERNFTVLPPFGGDTKST